MREPFGVTIATCQLRDVLDRAGGKWSVLVMALIGTGPKRGSQLQHAIDGISHRMLTLTLRSLERDGLIRGGGIRVADLRESERLWCRVGRGQA